MSNGPDSARRRFLTGAATVVGGAGTACAAWPFASAWQPSERARAIGAPVEVDVGKIEPGARLTVKWRGKPVWIVRRTKETLESLPGLDAVVRDPASDEPQQPEYARNPHRSIKPELLVLVGAVHPPRLLAVLREKGRRQPRRRWQGGFFCPCHGSRFDYAGRVYQGVPAPTNLEVPPHQYLSDTRIVIGEDEGAA